MSPGTSIRHPKARGEWAELRFMLRATELGLRVTKPCVVILRSALFARRRTWARRANILAFFARMLNRAFGALPYPYPLISRTQLALSEAEESGIFHRNSCK